MVVADGAMAGGAPLPPQAAERDGRGVSSDGRQVRRVGGHAGYSGTNTHEAGVDEPDLVKTDGRRIVTVSGGALRVVDAASRTTSSASSTSAGGGATSTSATSRPTCCSPATTRWCCCGESYVAAAGFGGGRRPAGIGRCPRPTQVLGPRAGAGRPVRDAAGALPAHGRRRSRRRPPGRLDRPGRHPVGPAVAVPVAGAGDRRRAHRRPTGRSSTRPAWTRGCRGSRSPPAARPPATEVDCDAISRPDGLHRDQHAHRADLRPRRARRSETADRSRIVADGDTVYSNGPSLYVASDQRWRVEPMGAAVVDPAKPVEARTEIYKFDTSTPDRPSFVAGGDGAGLPHQPVRDVRMGRQPAGRHDDRAAGRDPDQRRASESGVYVLAQSGEPLWPRSGRSRARQGRAHLRRALRRAGRLRRHVPPDRSAVHSGPARSDQAAGTG